LFSTIAPGATVWTLSNISITKPKTALDREQNMRKSAALFIIALAFAA
jgi:hypothetical protein